MSSNPNLRDAAAPASGMNHVLLAEDDRIYRHILATWLRNWGYHVTLAEDGNQAWEILQHEPAPQLLIFDWIMPGIEGPELCRKVRELQLSPYPYILLLTSKDESKDIIFGLDAGADDYLVKPCDVGELRARVAVGTRVLNLQHELIRAREELRFGATHDALTGLWNRAAIVDLLSRELQREVRSHSSVGVMMLDIDHFKKVNDTYGHQIGDVVLREASARIQQALRSYDFVGRYGGEEFIAVLSECAPPDIQSTAERVRHALEASPILAGELSIPITISVGVAATKGQPRSVESLVSAADQALYSAKKNGRNRVEIEPASHAASV